MALRLGRRIQKLELEVATLKSVLMTYRDIDRREIPWSNMALETARDSAVAEIAAKRLAKLESIIAFPMPGVTPLHALHEAVFLLPLDSPEKSVQ